MSAEDWAWWRASNDWIDATYPDPGIADPTLFDKTVNPTATCWFKSSAATQPMMERVEGYLALLDRYGIAWRERHTDMLGRVLYDDAIQTITDGQP